MKDTDPLPYKSKCLYNKAYKVDDETVKVYELISESFDDLLYKMFIKPYIKVFGKYKNKKIK